MRNTAGGRPLLTDWTVEGFYDNEIFFRNDNLERLDPVLDAVPAAVPGNVQADLWRAGKIQNPYFGLNSLNCEWVENRWWLYRTAFSVPDPGEDWALEFAGVDDRCHILLNGEEIFEHEGMYTPFRVPLTGKLRAGRNELGVAIEKRPNEISQIGRSSENVSEKGRFNYKWYFCARLVSVGIWKPVWLARSTGLRIESLRFDTGNSLSGDFSAEVVCDCVRALSGSYAVRVFDGEDVVFTGETSFRLAAGKRPLALRGRVPHPVAWELNGAGEHKLYRVELSLTEGARTLDERTFRVGFRTLELVQNEGCMASALPYTICLNGRRRYLKGVNLVPLDALPGTVTEERYRRLLESLRRMNVNFIRVWGGGIIETEAFYDLCDEMGFLVMQDFVQSGSALDNIPSEHPHYLQLLREEAEFAVRTLRNHVSLGLWCGGNELTEPDGTPLDFRNPNLAMLRDIVNEHSDAYLYSGTPTGPRFCFVEERPELNHEVHGSYWYLGEEAHYDYFNRLKCHIHSEFGVNGMASCEQIAACVPDCGVTDSGASENWRHHGAWWDMRKAVETVFGPMTDLATFVRCSQFLQNDGYRYGLESNRRQFPYNSGTYLWQANEPFPNVFCTSVVEYFGREKRCAKGIAHAYQSVNPNLRYEKLVWQPGELWRADWFLTSSEERAVWSCRAEVFSAGTLLADHEATVEAGDEGSVPLGSLSCPVPAGRTLEVRMSAVSGARRAENAVVFLIRGENGFADPVREEDFPW